MGIPGSTKGYICFEEHAAARKCVDEQAGSWSESERCVAESSWSNWKSWNRGAYGMDVSKLIVGQRGKNLSQEMEKVGASSKLHFGTDGGYAAFTGKVTKPQLVEIKTHLAELLAAAHAEINSNVRQIEVDAGLPKAFTPAEATDFFKAFGTIESFELADPDPDNPDSTPKACVVYKASEEAFCAQAELRGAMFFGTAIISSLCPVGHGKDDNKKSRGSEMLATTSPTSQSEMSESEMSESEMSESDIKASRNKQRWSEMRVSNGERNEYYQGDGVGEHNAQECDLDEYRCTADVQETAEVQGEDVWVCICGFKNDEGAFVCGEFSANEGCGQPRDQ